MANGVDYDQLAKKHGATVDYDALAAKYGASLTNPTLPATTEKVPWYTGVGGALAEEGAGIADVLNPLPIVQSLKRSIDDPMGQASEFATWAATRPQEWKKEYEVFKADPYAYLLKAAPRNLGRGAAMVLTGKAIKGPVLPEEASLTGRAFTGTFKTLKERAAETGSARLTERLTPMTEGKPTAELVKRTLPNLDLTGKEPLYKVQNTVERASAKVTELERKLLKTPYKTAPRNPLNPFSKPVTTTIGDVPVSGKPVADELRKLSTATTKRFEESLANAIEARAKDYEKSPMTLNGLHERLAKLNKQSTAIYSKPDIESALASHDPKIAFLEGETNAVRNAYYDELSRLSNQDLRSLKKIQSDFIGMQKALASKVGKEATAEAARRAHPLIGPKGSWQRKALKVGGAGALAGAGFEGARRFIP